MGIFISDNPIREITDIHVGIDNIARRCKKGWVGVDGVARLIFVDDTVDPTEIRRFGTYYETTSGSYSRTETHICDSSEIIQDYMPDWIQEDGTAPSSEIPSPPTKSYGQLYSLYIKSSSPIIPKYQTKINCGEKLYPGRTGAGVQAVGAIMYTSPQIVTVNGIEYKKYENICFAGIKADWYDDSETITTIRTYKHPRICRFVSDYIPNEKNMASEEYVSNPWEIESINETCSCQITYENYNLNPNFNFSVNITLKRNIKYDFLWQGTPPPASLWELSGVELVDSSDPTQGAFQIWRKR